MRFDERKMKILSAIVETYIRTGEPVGSKTLSEMPGIGVSPATVRNEMASLFSMGLLEQPHTSAGRIPSHLGYRIYVDRLMKEEPLTEKERDEIDALFNVGDPDPDRLLQDAAEALAEYTDCATVAMTTTPSYVTVEHIDIVPADKSNSAVLSLIAFGMKSKARIVIVPMQDYLQLDSSDRLNTPGIPSGNWEWRLSPDDICDSLTETVKRLSHGRNKY